MVGARVYRVVLCSCDFNKVPFLYPPDIREKAARAYLIRKLRNMGYSPL